MNAKTKKIISLVINITTVVICIFILCIAVSSIGLKNRGYNSFFGKAYYAVQSNSMAGTNKDSFKKGDIITVDILKTIEQKKSCKVGTIITFWDDIDGKQALNSHRIIKVEDMGDNGVFYITKGDNIAYQDIAVNASEVVGVYTGKIKGIGSIALFFQSPTGFLILVVIPSLLVVLYCAFLLFRNIKTYNLHKTNIAIEHSKEDMRKEILEEINKAKIKEDESK